MSGNPQSRSDRFGLLDVWIGGADDDSSKIVRRSWGSFSSLNRHRRSEYFEWWQSNDVLKLIADALAANPCEKINLIGHSLGGSAAWHIAQQLRSGGLAPDLLITIDPVGRLVSSPRKLPPQADTSKVGLLAWAWR